MAVGFRAPEGCARLLHVRALNSPHQRSSVWFHHTPSGPSRSKNRAKIPHIASSNQEIEVITG